MQQKIELLHHLIKQEEWRAIYCSYDFTIKHKLLVCQAFYNLSNKFPKEMIDYIMEDSRCGGFQHKIFQEYIRLLEEELPFQFQKRRKTCVVISLLDEQLKLFDGISTFDAVVSNKLEIKNNTKELYLFNRKGNFETKICYIGKLLSIFDLSSNENIMDKVVEYTFNKIKMKDIDEGTYVRVTHLRIPPHYDMGGMSYVNRIRKNLVKSYVRQTKEES
jgi:hypothetical protein